MRRAAAIFVFVLMIVVLPLAGAWLAARPVTAYLHLSPQPTDRAPASFVWPAFLIYAVLILGVVGPAIGRIVRARIEAADALRGGHFPAWGWAGVALTLVAWAITWSRIPALADIQLYTFTPLWLGYIVTVNALTCRRTGRCLLRDRPGGLIALFPASAAFWWLFEYMNRYIGNWHYVGLEALTPLGYFIHASLAFSTVLPAVASTREWLASMPRLQHAFRGLPPVAFGDAAAWTAVVLGAIGFVVLGAWPHYAYALAWAAPVLALIGLQALAGQRHVVAGLRAGDWSGLGLSALAALVTGFFWEMWNWKSLAHWEYSIPLVDGFRVFEMPVLGYAGYLPFGIACVLMSELVCGASARNT
ncbi:MAG TPA: hypothetical protein VIL43_13775 [Burkholderiales bacterium]